MRLPMKPTKPLKRVLIMAGGTGGHVFPGLAVARYLRENGVEVHWLGTKQGMESRVVPAENIPLHLIAIGGLRGKGLRTLLTAPFKITVAVKQALAVMRKVKPDAVLGMGGFVSGPGGMASWLSRCPLVIHEQNAKAGFTNKVLARFAKRVLEGFPDVFYQQEKVIAVGNPVRSDIEHLPAPAKRLSSDTLSRLLILGGSLGAQGINEILPRALLQLKADERPEIWHQTGDKHAEATKKLYESMGLEVKLTPFINDMAQAYAWANMVLCRAGALTVAELCSVGLGAILVPYPYATDDHQTANADFMVKNGAALCIQQAELTDSRLADIIKQFSQSPQKRLSMAEAAYQLRKVNVAEKIYAILCDVIN
jgi:UDP-N-acetylglucosamine--N-acetylmuramyl-(pentapeptide) pyrophosphoryl-undecaprenol N-acetylglucosamine transferase